jgi:hypothetical protein
MNGATVLALAEVAATLQAWAQAIEGEDPVQRAEEGNHLMTYLREQSVLVPAQMRRSAIREMLSSMSIREAAKELGLAPSRIVQIRDGR